MPPRSARLLDFPRLMTPDFTRIPYGFDEFERATVAQWQQAAGQVEPWPSPEGIAHRALYTDQDQQPQYVFSKLHISSNCRGARRASCRQLPGERTRLPVHLQNISDCARRCGRQARQRLLHDLMNGKEADSPLQKCLHRYLIGRVQRASGGPAGLLTLIGQPQ